MRMCVVCRARQQKQHLVRISTLNGEAVVDNYKQQTTRAIYVCKQPECTQKLIKNKLIKRLLHADANENFYNEILN